MEDFEQQLRSALARKQQPPSFEAKSFAAIAAEDPGAGCSGAGRLWPPLCSWRPACGDSTNMECANVPPEKRRKRDSKSL